MAGSASPGTRHGFAGMHGQKIDICPAACARSKAGRAGRELRVVPAGRADAPAGHSLFDNARPGVRQSTMWIKMLRGKESGSFEWDVRRDRILPFEFPVAQTVDPEHRWVDYFAPRCGPAALGSPDPRCCGQARESWKPRFPGAIAKQRYPLLLSDTRC